MQRFLDSIKSQLDAHIYRRHAGFSVLFKHLAVLPDPIHIVETGCCRKQYPYDSDGGATLLFDRFLQDRIGSCISVDIDKSNVDIASLYVSKKTSIVHSDSVSFLKNHSEHINLLYLDSYDLDRSNIHPAAEHSLKELMAAKHLLSTGSLVASDDNFPEGGKGTYVKRFMESIGAVSLHCDYQMVWVWP